MGQAYMGYTLTLLHWANVSSVPILRRYCVARQLLMQYFIMKHCRFLFVFTSVT